MGAACVRILLKYKAPTDIRDEKQRTPLHYAVTSEAIVEMIVSAGAELNDQDYQGDTALMIATKLGEIGIVRQLIQLEASFTLENKRGNPPLHYASPEIAELIEEHMEVDNGNDEVRAIY